jgi:peroxiredoxin
MLHIGDTAPNLTLALVDGRPIPLSEFWRGGPAALLIFLRHLG